MTHTARFATWNIKNGGIDPDGSEERRLGQIEVLKEQPCDVLGLQELSGWEQDDWRRLYELANALKMVPLPPVTSRVGDGRNHLALLYRPETVDVLGYTGARGREVFHHGTARARLSVRGTQILTMVTHLSWTDGSTRLAEARWFTDYAGEFGGPVQNAALLGDLNTLDPQDEEPDWEDVPQNLQSRYRLVHDDGSFGDSDRRAAHLLFNSGWTDPHTVLRKPKGATVGHGYPNEPTPERLDYTLITSPLEPAVTGAWTLDDQRIKDLSDHLPTGFDLTLPISS